jgi:hypothetical protein
VTSTARAPSRPRRWTCSTSSTMHFFTMHSSRTIWSALTHTLDVCVHVCVCVCMCVCAGRWT